MDNDAREYLRRTVRSIYDLQKLRIAEGNRIVINVRAKMGQKPGMSTEEMDEEAQKLLQEVLRYHKSITEAATHPVTRGRFAKKSKDPGVIAEFLEDELVNSYCQLKALEDAKCKTLEIQLEQFPIWMEFLKSVRGCGPLMAAVLISTFDPHRGRYVSSFWRYAGYDVVVLPDGTTEGRGKKAAHLVDREYIAADGTTQIRKSITFNPWLKSKLYVLGTSFLKANSPYRIHYDNYKHRLTSNPNLNLTKGHIHARAMRYMMKMFLKDLYLEWRKLENLPIHEDYASAKLGMQHHTEIA